MLPIIRSNIFNGVKKGFMRPVFLDPLLRLQTTERTVNPTPHKITQEEARTKAQAILEMFPGDSLFKKSAYATLTGGLASFLVARGIYIPNEETLILVAFLIMSRLAYVKLSGPIASLFETYINDLKSKLRIAALANVETIEKEIEYLEGFRDNREVTDAYFEIKRENVVLEAELSELQQSLTHFSSIKSRLDDRLRKENERIAMEKKLKVEALMKALIEEIKKPKIQEALMKKCLLDLGKIQIPSSARQPEF